VGTQTLKGLTYDGLVRGNSERLLTDGIYTSKKKTSFKSISN
jgi:hypothetical protein